MSRDFPFIGLERLDQLRMRLRRRLCSPITFDGLPFDSKIERMSHASLPRHRAEPRPEFSPRLAERERRLI